MSFYDSVEKTIETIQVIRSEIIDKAYQNQNLSVENGKDMCNVLVKMCKHFQDLANRGGIE